MNRKLIEERKNDIPIIIGNLPKRLQKKIADETGTNCCFIVEQRADGAECNLAAKPIKDGPCIRDIKKVGKNLPAITILQDSNARVSGVQRTASQEDLKSDITSIPGILRLNNFTQSMPKKEGHYFRRGVLNQKLMRNSGKTRLPSDLNPSKCPSPVWFRELIEKDINYVQLLPEKHDQLLSMMPRKFLLDNYWDKFCEHHAHLQNMFAYLLVNHLKFCCEQKVDNYFWKILFYNIIEHLKQNDPIDLSKTLFIINNGLSFYGELLVKLNKKYAPLGEERETHQKFSFIAKVSAQKILICLGDLSRYKMKFLQSNDFSESSNFYQSAQKLIPTNGIPYNQLAVLAIYDRKKFDAVYFHMRSLMASNAINSAKESLHVLFDEIRRKYEEVEGQSSPFHKTSLEERKSKSLRKEVWIQPGGARSVQLSDINLSNCITREENILKKLTMDEVLRRFTSLYLYVIGKFFTGIGMETIQEHQRKLLIQLRFLLRSNPLVISSNRLLKIAALNIFIMEHNKDKDNRREIRYQSFIFCNEIFGLLLRKCNELFNAHLASILMHFDDEGFQDLTSILKYVNIYTIWLGDNVALWEPIRCEEQFMCNPWRELLLLFSNIENVLIPRNINCNDYSSAILEENIYLDGFTPILKSSSSVITYDAGSLDKNEQFIARLNKIAKFRCLYNREAERLKTKNDFDARLDALSTELKGLVTKCQNDDGEVNNSENIASNCNERRVGRPSKVIGSISNANATIVEQNEQVSQLSKLKKELEAKSNFKKMYTAKLDEILKFVDTKLYIEVRPKYLMPDTNCFIDCLEDFEKLVQQHKCYILIIPLTVVKELDGLAKGVKIESYERALQKKRIHHFDDVSTRAKKSLDFVKASNNNVKCATTKGSIINASLFGLVEEEYVSNDDKILATALALSKTMSTETTKDGKCFIQTELVLITTDRNLRVKALSRNLAVSNLSDFQQWANDCQQ